MTIYHIVLPQKWNSLELDAAYVADSLEMEGFIHCSYHHQLGAVLKRYYANVKEVIILSIDTERLTSRLVEEPSTNNEVYPHIYGPINRDSIIDVKTREL